MSFHARDVANMTEADRAAFLASLTQTEAEDLQYDWSHWARPEQRLPDLIMSQEETQCIQHLTPGGSGAQSISVQCGSIVFIADKDTSVIYMCSAIVGTNFNVQQGRFIGGLPPNGGFFCRRDIVPTPPPPFVCYYLAKKSYRYGRCSRRSVDTKHGRVKLEY